MILFKKSATIIISALLSAVMLTGCTGVTETMEESSKGITVSDIVSELSKEISDIQEEVNSETESSDEETSSEVENVSDESSEVEDIIVETKENNYYTINEQI